MPLLFRRQSSSLSRPSVGSPASRPAFPRPSFEWPWPPAQTPWANFSGVRPDRTNLTIWSRNTAGYGGLVFGVVDTSSSQEDQLSGHEIGSTPFEATSALDYDPFIVKEFRARTVFLSSFLSRRIHSSSDLDQKTTLLLKDPKLAELARDRLAAHLNLFDGPQVLVIDLAGIAFTPLTLQELILPLAQRIRGGEYGTVRLVISTTDPAVSNFIRYMAQAHQLPLYLSQSPLDLREGTPVGALTRTERSTLNTINVLGGQVTAASLAATEGIRPSAATNRLVNLDREGYLVRQPRGRREGDLYVEPRSATSTPTFLEEAYEVSENSTGFGKPVGPTVSANA